jgi:hypothetical protein
VAVDTHYRTSEPKSSRWDYVIGFDRDGVDYVVWVEPHSATSTHEITTMINKFKWLRDKLALDDYGQLRLLTERTGQARLRKYWWVTTGKINIRRGTPQEKRLAIVGLNYPVALFRLGQE